MTFLEWVQYNALIKGMQPHNYLRYLLLYKRRPLPIETDESGKMLIFKEWRHWMRDYIPNDGIIGKTILDVGAGSGETAWFYLTQGARKVICIEPDLKRIAALRRNAEKWRWDIEVIERRFKSEDMMRLFDFAKIDCEGGERLLLDLQDLPSLAVEIHGKELAKRFAVQFPSMSIKKKFHWPFNTWMGRIG